MPYEEYLLFFFCIYSPLFLCLRGSDWIPAHPKNGAPMKNIGLAQEFTVAELRKYLSTLEELEARLVLGILNRAGA